MTNQLLKDRSSRAFYFHNLQSSIQNAGFKIAVFLCVALAVPAWCKAQEPTGTILGTVTDQQGAVVPAAQVTLTNVATQGTRRTLTDRSGNYEVVDLPIGRYQVTIERSGFRKTVSDPEALDINQDLRIDLRLEVGLPSEVVEVSSQSGTVETLSPTLGQTVTSRELVNLPLNGRNTLDLALLQPGVTDGNVQDFPGRAGAGTFSIAGGRPDSVTFLLDGGLNNSLLNNGVVYNPNPDTVQEFKLLTSNYTAEYGRNGGGIISVATKSGTNQYHGSAFEFIRNDALDATSFFNNELGIPKNALKRNQFGFTFGGPITIPKVVNGKDRFFFFVGYQGTRQVQGEVSPADAFTPAELRGDFSLSNPSRTGPDESVVGFLQANPFFQPNPGLAAQGIIDPSRINSISQKYIAAGLIPTSPTGELFSQANVLDNRDELTLKFDAVATQNDRFSVTLGLSNRPNTDPFPAANFVGFPTTIDDRSRYANISYTKTFSPNVLNVFIFTAQRLNSSRGIPAANQPTAANLGIGVTPDLSTGPPRLIFEKNLLVGFAKSGPVDEVNDTFSFSDTVSYIKGRHTFKFGAGFSPYENNTQFAFDVNGSFFFSGSQGIGTANYASSNPNGSQGNSFADFLLGLPDEYTQGANAASNIRTKSYYGFAQDEWKVRKRLVLTLGLRYEYSTPRKDTEGRTFSIIPGQQSIVFPNAPRGLVFPGDPGAPTGVNFPDKNNFAPRFGFAYDVFGDAKTSIRGGFGVFYDVLKGEDILQYNGVPPFYGSADLLFNSLSANPTSEVNYLSQPFIAAGSPNPFPSQSPPHNLDFNAAGFIPFGGSGIYAVDPHLRTPYTYQYNLSLQREVSKGIIAEANYVGSSSHGLSDLIDGNPFILGTPCRLLNSFSGNSCGTLLHDPGTFSYLNTFANASNANLNSMELSLTKRISETKFFGNTYFTLAYTWSHNIDVGSGFRNSTQLVPTYDRTIFRGDADFDIRDKFSFSGGWDLPLERAFKSLPKRLTSGWSLYPIVTFRTGFPQDVYAGLSRSGGARPGPSGAGDGELTKAFLANGTVVFTDPEAYQTIDGAAGNYFFDPTVFSNGGLSSRTTASVTDPAVRTYGTLGRDAFRGPNRFNTDFAVAKTTPLIGEKLRMEFRAEFFNIFNHTEFMDPDTSITDTTFGHITSTYDPRIIQFAVRFTF